MRSRVRLILGLALSGALVAACSGAGANPAPTPVPTAVPTVAPVAAATTAPAPEATETPAAAPTPTPMVMTDGKGDEAVRGTMGFIGLTKNYAMTKVGEVNQYRGGVAAFKEEMNDTRVSGTATFTFSLDTYTATGPEWGEVTINNDKGAWTGTCTGGDWANGDGIAWSCWLTGSGDYEGYTYYRQVSKEASDTVATVIGVVYPGEPPKP
jgi:hypothetical protein